MLAIFDCEFILFQSVLFEVEFLLSFLQNNALCDLSKQIVAQATLEPTLHLIMNMAHDLFEADIVSLFLIDRETHMMHKVNTQIGVEVIRISMAKGIFDNILDFYLFL